MGVRGTSPLGPGRHGWIAARSWWLRQPAWRGWVLVPDAPIAAAAGPVDATARLTILFFLCGGASHVDTWDMKPEAPAGYRGPFRPVETTAPGVRLCEHLPMLARQAHHLAVVNSVGATVNTNDHHAGYYYNLTGHVPDPSFKAMGNDRTARPDDWPYLGCVAASRCRPPRLPGAITLPHRPSKAPYTRPANSPRGWGSSTSRCMSTARSAGRCPSSARPDAERRGHRAAAPGSPQPARGRRRGSAGPRSRRAAPQLVEPPGAGMGVAGVLAHHRGVRRRRRAREHARPL